VSCTNAPDVGGQRIEAEGIYPERGEGGKRVCIGTSGMRFPPLLGLELLQRAMRSNHASNIWLFGDGGYASARVGSSTTKPLPRGSPRSTRMEPPCALTASAQKASPNPAECAPRPEAMADAA